MSTKDFSVRNIIIKSVSVGFCLGIVFLLVTNYAMTATDKPIFCGNCHIMSSYSTSLLQGPHAQLTCNDCHAPYAILEKIPFKAMAGAKDIFVNTFYNLSDVKVTASERTREVIMENCMRCHANTNMNVRVINTDKTCWSCHRHISHNNGAFRGVLPRGNR